MFQGDQEVQMEPGVLEDRAGELFRRVAHR